MSLLCMFQLVKHQDAVGILYPHTLPDPQIPITSKVEHVKISAHIDCERSKGFVQYRWYSSDIRNLVHFLSSSDKDNKRVVGCCSLGHWKRKPPGRDSAKSSSQLMVSANLDVKDVFSPFELDSKRQPSHGLDTPNVSVLDWETLDASVWACCRSLNLLPPEVLDASLAIPFPKDLHIQNPGSIFCGEHCDTKVSDIVSHAAALGVLTRTPAARHAAQAGQEGAAASVTRHTHVADGVK